MFVIAVYTVRASCRVLVVSCLRLLGHNPMLLYKCRCMLNTHGSLAYHPPTHGRSLGDAAAPRVTTVMIR